MKNLSIVVDDWHELSDCLAPAYSSLQRIENIFEPVSVSRRGDLSPLRSGYPRRESQAPAASVHCSTSAAPNPRLRYRLSEAICRAK